jgi:hypothetical protein
MEEMELVGVGVCAACADRTFNEPCNEDYPCTGTHGEGAFREPGHCQVCKDLTYIRSVDADSGQVVKLLLEAPQVRATLVASGIRRALRLSK